MKRPDATDYRRAGVSPAPPAQTPPPPGRLRRLARPAALIASSVAMLSLAFAPVSQCYLAWVGLVPYLLLVHECPTHRKALLFGWLAGIVFIVVNMWWLVFVTVPGTLALAAYLGLFFGIVAVVIRQCGLLTIGQSPGKTVRSVLWIAAAWTALEWVRGSYSPFGKHGLPWLYLGYTQTPLLPLCQIADFAGVYGVTFSVTLVNALLATWWLNRDDTARIRPAIITVVCIALAILGYGTFRMHQAATRPGPTVMVVQPNYPQSNSGEKGADLDEIVHFHVTTTADALRQCQAKGTKVDLVIWSETMMPGLNRATRQFMRGVSVTWNTRRYDYGQFIDDTSQQISDLADQFRTGFLVGGTFSDRWKWMPTGDGNAYPIAEDHRNSAYFYEPTGVLSDTRYDKIRLLPFGEFVPFKEGLPALYRLLVSLGPPDMKYYELTPGAPDALTVFTLDSYPPREDAAGDATSKPVTATASCRFVTPICFEDIVAPLASDLFHAASDQPIDQSAGESAGGKRADFIVNITNDGWFKANERAQHFQAATFRSIENRVPTARSVNTGVSGFVDSVGRASDCVAAGTQGWSVHSLALDSRVTFYTRFGDVFAWTCGLATLGLVCAATARAAAQRRRRAAATSA